MQPPTAPATTSQSASGAQATPRGRGPSVLAGFGITLVILELAVRLFAGHLPPPQLWSTPEAQFKVDQIRHWGPADVAIVGSSIVDVGIDPSVLGPTAYNASLGAASIGMVSAFTRSVVIPDLDPTTVIVGIASRELNRNAPDLPAIEGQFLAAPGARQALGTETLLDRADRLLSDVSYLARYRTVLRQPKTWFGDPQRSWDGTVTRRDGLYLGFLDDRYHDEPAVLARFRNGALHDFQLGSTQMATLQDLLTDLHDQGRRVLLVSVPVTQDYIDAYPHGLADHERFVAAARSIATDSGAAFIDAGVWDRSLMADPLHSNGAGNRRLSAMVAKALGR